MRACPVTAATCYASTSRAQRTSASISTSRRVQHALRNAAFIQAIAEDPTRYLVLGPDRAANLLEFVVLDRPQGPAVMHAMPMRTKYRRLLPKDW